MDRKFKMYSGEVIEDLGVYLRDFLKKNPGEQVYVGVDSKTCGKVNKYGIAICLHNPEFGKGVHIVFDKQNIKRVFPENKTKAAPRMEEQWQINDRIWNEVLILAEIGEYLENELSGFVKRHSAEDLEKRGFKNHQNKLANLCVDINPVPLRKQKGIVKENKSNKLYDMAINFLSSKGFRVTAKPEAWASSCAADALCRRNRKRRRS